MTESERSNLEVSIARVEAKLDIWMGRQNDHEQRIREQETNTLHKKEIEAMISDAVNSTLNKVESMNKFTWADIGKLTTGIIGALAAVVGIVYSVVNLPL